MKESETKIEKLLVIGIGNTGRGDDGLGWKFADEVKASTGISVVTEYRYQLQVEDAELISHYAMVVFADATEVSLPEGFEMRPCIPASHYYFSSHLQSPEAVLYLSSEIYGKVPQAFLMAITGCEWELSTSLSAMAEFHLQKAIKYFIDRYMLKNSIWPSFSTPLHEGSR